MKTIVAIVTIALLLGYAMYQQIDGAILSVGIATIAGLGGYALHKKREP